MLAYKSVYSLVEGKPQKNLENKIEYTDKNGKRRVKTNPTYDDFRMVGKYPILEIEGEGEIISYEIENGYIVPKFKEEK